MKRTTMSLMGDGRSKISDYDREHVGAILGGNGDWFSAKLLRLIAHCDAGNLEAIRSIYPDHVEAYEEWMASDPVREGGA